MQDRIKSYKKASRTEKLYPLLRISYGIYFAITYGVSKMLAGAERREGLGSTMEMFGITGGHIIFGFLAAFFESIGAILISLGIATRRMAAGLSVTMLVAVIMKITTQGDPTNAIIRGIPALIILMLGGRELALGKLREKKTKSEKK